MYKDKVPNGGAIRGFIYAILLMAAAGALAYAFIELIKLAN